MHGTCTPILGRHTTRIRAITTKAKAPGLHTPRLRWRPAIVAHALAPPQRDLETVRDPFSTDAHPQTPGVFDVLERLHIPPHERANHLRGGIMNDDRAL